eukprot:scaffold3942_cov266-Pinguiococcus_pyrenoidosus.AAC.1
MTRTSRLARRLRRVTHAAAATSTSTRRTSQRSRRALTQRSARSWTASSSTLPASGKAWAFMTTSRAPSWVRTVPATANCALR